MGLKLKFLICLIWSHSCSELPKSYFNFSVKLDILASISDNLVVASSYSFLTRSASTKATMQENAFSCAYHSQKLVYIQYELLLPNLSTGGGETLTNSKMFWTVFFIFSNHDELLKVVIPGNIKKEKMIRTRGTKKSQNKMAHGRGKASIPMEKE